jgi:DNA-binding beta-propeller fold protein YncE/mono/diheme cytochrome c family protein
VRALLLAALLLAPAIATAQSFVNFESGQVRPLALSPSGERLFAVNTPDNRLEVFAVGASGLRYAGSVPVGLEPVAVAARSDGEVWVVNHLSDSVSIVDVAASPPRVVRTLLVGDEPRDVVFAGPGGNRAFVTTAHRGQNSPMDPQLTTEGVGRADVFVFDALDLGTSLGGTPLTVVTLFGDTPRALAASADGSRVYAAVFHSGNRTTTVSEGVVCNGGASAGSCTVGGTTYPGGLPAPNVDADGVPGPETGLIVKYNPAAGQWQDELGRNWSNAVRFSLPDLDVFAIDADAATPVEVQSWSGVGTVLFNMVASPTDPDKLWVTNTEARNEVRFEGPGEVFGSTSVRGRLHEARITVLDGTTVTPRHLNPHIDYDLVPSPPGTRERSLATPLGMAASADGETLWVAAFGSSKVAALSTAELDAGTFVPDEADHAVLSGGGPTGLVLDEPRGRLYVLTRFDNAISIVDTATLDEVGHVPLYSPEPAEVVLGRPFLYEASFTSSNGEASCASCHVFADLDGLAWDLGNPDDSVLNNPNPFRFVFGDPDFHPLKGPMTTQSLRGMANHGPMHWRGDRTGGNDPGGDALDEEAAFEKFNPAFAGLLGRGAELSQADMAAFTDFVLTVTYPPNPIRALDESLTAAQDAGRDLFFGRVTDTLFNCNGCHVLDRAQGFFGTDGLSTFENEPQHFKIAHLRNAYAKVGMFGMPQVPFVNAGNNGHTGDQIRGFGFLHDGSIDTLFRFLSAGVFSTTTAEKQQLEQFILAFDSNLFPIAGQQVTLAADNAVVAGPRIDLLIARAALDECDLVVKGAISGLPRGAVRLPGGTFRTDRASEAPLGDAELRALAATAGQELTYTCVPPGSGTRIGVDRDEDGALDRDEIDAGSDPADPTSLPGGLVRRPIPATTLLLRDDPTPPFDPALRKVRFRSLPDSGTPGGHVLPALGGNGDPSLHGARLTVYEPGGTEKVVLALPATGWTDNADPLSPAYKYRDLDGANGPIRVVTVKSGRIVVRGTGGALYALGAAPQGVMALRLRLGDGVVYCAAAPASAPAASNDTTERFVGAPGSPAPESCPPVP